jgi:hypothetical protein
VTSVTFEHVQKYSASHGTGQQKNLNMFNYSARPLVRRGQSGLKRKKAALRRMFFSSLRDYAAINVMMASRSQNGHCRIELER